ncbi:MAG: hypothetical protein WD749_03465, partial [Phycisphaerales bacterium]
PPPPGTPPSTPIPLQHAAAYEPLLAYFEGDTTAREALTVAHEWGLLAAGPEDPQTLALLRSLVEGGCLDIVDHSG